MGARGRKPQFTPRRNGNGNYRVYVPGQGVVDLGTTDEKTAFTKAHQYAQEYAGKTQTPVSTPTPQPSAPSTKAAEMLTAWEQSPQSSTGFSQPSSDAPSPSQSSYQAPTQPSLPATSPVAPSVQSRVAEAMPADKRRKVADLLAGVATRLNVVAVAASVKLLGRVPATEEDEDAEAALKEGWALQLEELFVNHPPAPWMIILGGSAAIGLGMYTNGTPIPKKNRLAPPENTLEIPDGYEPDPSAG
jgi:hypothetical protein